MTFNFELVLILWGHISRVFLHADSKCAYTCLPVRMRIERQSSESVLSTEVARNQRRKHPYASTVCSELAGPRTAAITHWQRAGSRNSPTDERCVVVHPYYSTAQSYVVSGTKARKQGFDRKTRLP